MNFKSRDSGSDWFRCSFAGGGDVAPEGAGVQVEIEGGRLDLAFDEACRHMACSTGSRTNLARSSIHDAAQTLGVPAVCFGGRDRVRHLLTRLLED